MASLVSFLHSITSDQNWLKLLPISRTLTGDLMRLYPVRSNSQYPLQNFEVLNPHGNMVVKPLILRKQMGVLGPAFSRLVCESHGVCEADVPEDVIKVLQNQRVGAFLNSCPVGEAGGGAGGEPAALVPPPPTGGPAGGSAGPAGDCGGAVAAGDNVKAVVVEDQDSKVIGAIVGSRHVTNVVKTLQQVSIFCYLLAIFAAFGMLIVHKGARYVLKFIEHSY